MKDICKRTPWGLKRVILKHKDDTGVVVYGWFNRLRNWPEARGWDSVLVSVNGDKNMLELGKLSRGPFWISLPPGEHHLEFTGSEKVFRSEIVNLAEKDVILIAFKPSHQIPFRQSTPEQWCVRKLRIPL